MTKPARERCRKGNMRRNWLRCVSVAGTCHCVGGSSDAMTVLS